jgi:WD40 repeat protein
LLTKVGTLWSGSFILSVSLCGEINYLDPRVKDPVRVVKGHQKGISTIAAKSPSLIFSASSDGLVNVWDNGS